MHLSAYFAASAFRFSYHDSLAFVLQYMTGSSYFLTSSQTKEYQLVGGINRVFIFVIATNGSGLSFGRHNGVVPDQ